MSSTTVTSRSRSARIKVERGISKRPRGKDWLYSVYHEGRQISEEADGTPLTTIVAARQRRGELIGSSRRGEKPVLATKTTFGEVAEAWFQTKDSKRSSTTTSYRQALDLVLLPRFGKQKVASITPDAIAELNRDLRREGLHAIDRSRPIVPLKKNTIKAYTKPLSPILDRAVRRDMISKNPCDLLTPEERPQGNSEEPPYEWSEEEITGLLVASAKVAVGRYLPLLRLAVTSGPRKGEILGLQWRDLDITAGTLSIENQWGRDGKYGPPKTRAGVRVIPVTHEVRDELIALRLASKFSGDDDPIFATKTGRPMGDRSIDRWGFNPARDLAGLPASVTFHQLRHAAASRLIAAGWDPVTVAAVLGHRDSSETLRTYSHLFSKRKDKQAEYEALRASMSGRPV